MPILLYMFGFIPRAFQADDFMKIQFETNMGNEECKRDSRSAAFVLAMPSVDLRPARDWEAEAMSRGGIEEPSEKSVS